jgi:hypothetical protein
MNARSAVGTGVLSLTAGSLLIACPEEYHRLLRRHPFVTRSDTRYVQFLTVR